jgi:tRNA pseudouridine13 synthase
MLNSTIDLTLPYLSADCPGIGGRLRATTEHFIVEEIPLYEPVGEGQHLYVNLTKQGLTTKDIQIRIERLLQLERNAVGYAGMKDKYARTTQTFSIPMSPGNPTDDSVDQALVDRLAAELPIEIHWAQRHGNKLKPGHLLGNRFCITVTDLAVSATEALSRAETIANQLRQRGVPNFFGTQRFGFDGDNVSKGWALLHHKRRERNPWLRKFLLSAYQSYLCNLYLTRRINGGIFDQILLGDVAKKYETGGMFDVLDVAAEQPRYAAQEISFTAPLFGAKMWAAKDDAGALEEAIQTQAMVDVADWRKAKMDGSRRYGRLLLSDLIITKKQLAATDGTIAPEEIRSDNDLVTQREAPTAANTDALEFSFSLPKGAFATVVLREFMKVDLADVTGVDSDTE